MTIERRIEGEDRIKVEGYRVVMERAGRGIDQPPFVVLARCIYDSEMGWLEHDAAILEGDDE